MTSIAATTSSPLTSSTMPSTCNKTPSDANSSFAAVLTEASRSNAEPSEEKSAAFADTAKADFRKWKQGYLATGISADRRQHIEKFSKTFENIVEKAAEEGGYANPKAFLSMLNRQELEALQRIHCLADPIAPESLTEEGALNLLYSPDQSKDIDKDGFEMVGLAKTWRFPPPDAPESVKAAWKKTIAESGREGALLLSAPFMPLVAPCTGVGANAYLGPDTDYAALTRTAIERSIVSSRYDQPWQTETRAKEIAGLRSFLTNLMNT